MNKTLNNRFVLYIALIITVLMMVFGIGLISNSVKAATQDQLQPATGATEYRNEEASAAGLEMTNSNSDSDHPEDTTHGEELDPGLLGMFGIDWKLFIAQLINFGIVLLVLWKWVFKPVTSGLSERTAKIEGSLKEAEQIIKDRGDFEGWKQEEIAKVRMEASAIVTEAKQQAEVLKTDTVKSTIEEQNKIIQQTQKQLEQEKASMLNSAKAELSEIVIQATSTILKEKIDEKKDQQLIDGALKEAKS